MSFMFATCDRQRALGFIRKARPSAELHDTPESAGPFLDLIAADVIRVQDPDYHPSCEVVPGKNWDDSRHSEVVALCNRVFNGATP